MFTVTLVANTHPEAENYDTGFLNLRFLDFPGLLSIKRAPLLFIFERHCLDMSGV